MGRTPLLLSWMLTYSSNEWYDDICSMPYHNDVDVVTSGVVKGIRGYTPYDHLQKLKKSVIRSMTTSNSKKVLN